MLSAVETLGSAGAVPGRVPPYSRHHAHQPPPHQHHPAQHHHAYHPLHTILSPSAIGGQLQLPPLLGAQSSLGHAIPSVGNEFVRPYPKQRYEENRCFGIPSALTTEQRLKYGDPPPASAPGSNVLIHPQTGPVNLAVSSHGGGSGGGGDEFASGSLTYTQCHQTSTSNPIQSDGSKYSPGATIQSATYQQKLQQEQQHQQMLEFLGAQQQTTGNRMVCFPTMGSLDVFGGYSPLNYDMYPYRRVHGRPTYIPPPNHRPLEQRYTSGAAAFLPPRAPPPPSTDTSSTNSRLPKAAAAPVAIKSKLWHMPLSPPAPPTPPSHHTSRDISLPTSSSSTSSSSSSSNAPNTAEMDTLVASYRALKSAQLQHAYPRMWAPPDPLQHPPTNATYLNDLPSIVGPEEDKNGLQSSYPLIAAHSAPINHIPTLQDTYMASVQRHRPKFGSISGTSTSASTSSSTPSHMQQEFKVPLGMEGTLKQQRIGGSVRVEPPQTTAGLPYNAHGAFDGGAGSSSRRCSYEVESHDVADDIAAHQHILHTTVLKPKMFLRGSMISFRNGVKKPVEQVRLEDFLRTAAISPDVRLTEALTRRITPRYGSSSTGDTVKKILVRFTYDQQQRHGAIETTMDYPFFVTSKGWTSHNPEVTYNNYGLDCAPLEVGDVFIVLVPRHLPHESISLPTQLTATNTTEQRSSSIDHFAMQQNLKEDEKKLHIANAFSLNPTVSQCSPTEENAFLQHHHHHHRQQQHGAEKGNQTPDEQQQQRRHEENGGSASVSPTIIVEDNNPITPPHHSWMTLKPSGGGGSGGSGKRRQDGQRRATAKRKLTETQTQDVFRPDERADCSSIENTRRAMGSTTATEPVE
ncbi:ataxin-1 [Anopheles maculipalpis]|uniref:ataxin-1 n=1 Tax=Anopheles maculipalpis TaxID=1496333 RepID=UPI002158A2B2|nr:ataxin-1 [Anopheles maculipalpis]